jgi:hypothetical protein
MPKQPREERDRHPAGSDMFDGDLFTDSDD